MKPSTKESNNMSYIQNQYTAHHILAYIYSFYYHYIPNTFGQQMVITNKTKLVPTNSYYKNGCCIPQLVTVIERLLWYDTHSGYYIIVSLGKTCNANFITTTLCRVEDKHRCVFHNGIYWRKNRKQTNPILPGALKVSLGNNCPMLKLL